MTDTGILSLGFLSQFLTVSGTVRCNYQADCEGITVKLTQSGITEVPDKVRREKKTDADGNFAFMKIPRLSYGVEIEKPGFCWHKKLHRVKLEKESITNVSF